MDPAQMMMSGVGMPIMAAMMGNGYIVPPAGEEGGPPGYDPWRPAEEILIDPLGPGGGVVFRPRELVKDQIKMAIAPRLGRNQTMAQRSQAASDALVEVAKQQGNPERLTPVKPMVFSPLVFDGSKTGDGFHHPLPMPGMPVVPDVPVAVKPSAPPAVPVSQADARPATMIPQIQTATPPQPAPQLISSMPAPPIVEAGQPPPQYYQPLVHGSLQQALRNQPAVQAVQTVQTVPAAPTPFDAKSALEQLLPPGPPRKVVDFEVDGNPLTVQACFHYVIQDKQTLVLVFDDRVEGFPKQVLPVVDVPIVMQIRGYKKAYKLAATGLRFTFQPTPDLRYDMQILIILSEHEMPGG